MNNENIKKKQLRRTFDDTKNAQKQLREMVLSKIKNPTCLTIEEQQKWIELIADSFLSVGIDKKVFIDKPNIRISFGNLHTFALRFLDWDERVVFNYKNQDYQFPIKTLWEILYDGCLEVFPYALADALHMSKETEKREQWEPYSFSSEDRLDDKYG